jgi:hypothetical protein
LKYSQLLSVRAVKVYRPAEFLVRRDSLGSSGSRAAVAEMRQPDWEQGHGLDTSPEGRVSLQPAIVADAKTIGH